MEARHLIGKAAHEGGVVADHDQRGPGFADDAPEHGADVRGGALIHGGGGFVRQHHERGVDQRPGDGHALALPAGQVLRFFIKLIRDVQPVAQKGKAFLKQAAIQAQQLAGQQDVVPHAQKRQQAAGLQHIADVRAAQPGQRGGVGVEQVDALAAVRVQRETCRARGGQRERQHVQQGGLAAPAGPQHRKALSREHVQDGGAQLKAHAPFPAQHGQILYGDAQGHGSSSKGRGATNSEESSPAFNATHVSGSSCTAA